MALRIMTELGVPDGIFLDVAQHRIPDSGARTLEDVLLDKPGVIRQRGPHTTRFSYTVNRKPHGLTATYTPTGTLRLASLISDGAGGYLTFTTASATPAASGTAYTWDAFLTADPYYVFDSKPAVTGDGVLIGSARQYGISGSSPGNSKRNLAYWRGATKADYSTGTLSTTVNSKNVTGAGTSWTTNIEAGMFLFADMGAGNLVLLGVVDSISSNTALVLAANALSPAIAGNAYVAKAVRGLAHVTWSSIGRITASSASAVINGGKTKFSDQSIIAGDYVFAIESNSPTYLGTVTSVQSNSQLTLVANSTTSVTNNDYLIIRQPAQTYAIAAPRFGTLNAAWNGWQFSANRDGPGVDGKSETGRVFVHDPAALDATDLTRDGTWFDLPATQTNAVITGLAASETALLCFRENETYAMTGNTPDDFQTSKILDDGCYSTMSIVSHNGGVIWAGRKGVYLWDGVKITNLTDNRVRRWLTTALGTQDIDTYRMWAMEQNDHYILTVQLETAVTVKEQSGSPDSRTEFTLVFNLKTGAITSFQNTVLRGAVKTPTFGTWYLQPSGGTLATLTTRLSYATTLFGEVAVNDSTGYWGYGGGPQLAMESKLYDAGDAEIKKLWKQLQMWHILTAQNATNVEVFIGLGKTNSILAVSPFSSGTTWLNKRAKFLKRNTHMGFRFNVSDSTPSMVQLGPFAIGFKPQRPGRV